jgi:signal transduction histidine kinase
MNLEMEPNRRILTIDDNEAIHEDFRKILGGNSLRTAALSDAKAALFGEKSSAQEELQFELASALQGERALEMVTQSIRDGRPYAMAFVDVRMPPGWDGIETIGRLWKVDPNLLVVVCTAYSDYDWSDMVHELGCMHRWQILKKPFDNVEVRQLAASLTEKWDLSRRADLKLDQLQQMVEDRTRDIERVQQQLYAARKEQAVGTLAGGVAHEFNNLLQGIRGYTTFAMKGLDVEDVRYQDLSQVIQASDRAANLTQKLLEFTRQKPIQRTTLNLNDIITDLVHFLGAFLGAKFEIRTELNAIDDVHGDATALHDVLLNLCTNARDAMPTGGQITIKTEQIAIPAGDDRLAAEMVPGEYVLLSVSDTGCGVPAEIKGRIFDPFFTTKEVGQGTGLGLSMARGLVQQLGGMIEVDSDPDQGSTFRIYIPIVAEPRPARQAAEMDLPVYDGSPKPSNQDSTGSEARRTGRKESAARPRSDVQTVGKEQTCHAI